VSRLSDSPPDTSRDPSPAASRYAGGELPLFAHAVRWKRYWSSLVRPHVRGRVLEVGAGLGANTELLRQDREERWVCLEPDPELAGELRRRLARPLAEGRCEVVGGTLEDLDPARRFDAILYIDVLEHIEDDRGELARAAGRLEPGGSLVVLAPAHGFLYSPFDAAIGHYRRYDKASLLAAAPEVLEPVSLRYLDAAGLVLSLGNRLLLRRSLPTLRQILFWDRRVVPISCRLDPLLGYRWGKTVLGVWRAAGLDPVRALRRE